MSMPKPIKIHEKQLHEMLWKEPLSAVAKRLNIPDNDLRQICRNYGITRPNTDYWTNAYIRSKTPIPEYKPGYSGNRKIIIEPIGKVENSEFVIMSKQLMREEIIRKELKYEPTVPNSLNLPDKLIDDSRDALTGKTTWSTRRDKKIDTLHINVDPQNIERALLFMQSFIKVMSDRGHKLKFRNEYPCFVVYEQDIEVYLKELGQKMESNNKRDYSSNTSYAGKLQLLTGSRYRDVCIGDGVLKIEEQIVKAIALIENEVLERLEGWEKQRLESEKLERKEKKKKKLQEQKEKEFLLIKRLINEARAYDDSHKMRKYIEAVKQEEQLNGELSEQTLQWIEWANKTADWCDPVINKAFGAIEETQEKLHEEQKNVVYEKLYQVQKENFFVKKWWNKKK